MQNTSIFTHGLGLLDPTVHMRICYMCVMTLTALTLFNHLHSLSCFQADFCILLTLIVRRHHIHTHALVCTQGFSTLFPWGWWKKTGREPAASPPVSTWTAPRHSPTPTQPQPISTWYQIKGHPRINKNTGPKRLRYVELMSQHSKGSGTTNPTIHPVSSRLKVPR